MPDDKSPLDQMSELYVRRLELVERLIPLARAAALVLKDSGHPSTAQVINEVLFQIEAVDGEASDLATARTEELMRLLREKLGR